MRDGEEQQTDAEQEGAEQSLGEILKAARVAKDLSLEEVAAELRIEEHMLRALEEHEFDVLGAPVFAKGYLKQYAHRLDLSYDDVLAKYYRQADPRDVSIAPSKVIKLRDERQITVWAIAGIVLAVLAVSLFYWWLNQPEVSFEPAVTLPGDTVDDTGLDPEPRPAALRPLSPAPREEASPPEQTADSVETTGLDRDIAEPDATDDDEPGSPAIGPSEGASEPVADVAAEAPAPSGPSVSIVLDFREDSWVEATDGAGRRLYYGLGRSGEQSSLVGAPPIDLLLGNADGVSLEVDGTPYAVPESARQGNLARFTLDVSD